MPDTSAYYHAAYAVVAVLYTGYAVSLWVRASRVRERRRAIAAHDAERAPRAGA